MSAPIATSAVAVEVRAKDGDIVIPGDPLGQTSKYSHGVGTCVRRGTLYATLVGKVKVIHNEDTSKESTKQLPTMTVQAHYKRSGTVPEVGSRIIGKVININERQAKVNMLCLEGKMLAEPFHGVIRREDVRATEKDSVVIFNSFRPGDMVRARVVSLGEKSSYVLSTAGNELGVVLARCDECGEMMSPTSWCEMQCNKTGVREKRKVAKTINAVPLP